MRIQHGKEKQKEGGKDVRWFRAHAFEFGEVPKGGKEAGRDATEPSSLNSRLQSCRSRAQDLSKESLGRQGLPRAGIRAALRTRLLWCCF